MLCILFEWSDTPDVSFSLVGRQKRYCVGTEVRAPAIPADAQRVVQSGIVPVWPHVCAGRISVQIEDESIGSDVPDNRIVCAHEG